MSDKRLKEQRKENKFYCRTIATAVGNVVCYSLDEEFRRKSFEVLKVQTSTEVETKIYKKLRKGLNNGFRSNLKPPLTSNVQTPPHPEIHTTNVLQSEERIDEIGPEDFQGSSSSSNISLTNEVLKKNWLAMSSQKYRASLQSQEQLPP